MRIELTDQNVKQVHYGEDLIINGEEWEFVDAEPEEYSENGYYSIDYYKQPSTDKVFKIQLFYALGGHVDYQFKIDCQVKMAYEVVEEIVQIERWIAV